MKILTYREAISNLSLIKELLASDGVISFETDTIRGFSCNIDSLSAIKKIYEIKNRKYENPLLVLVDSVSMCTSFTNVTDSREKILLKYWPGEISFVLPLRPELCKLDTINLVTSGKPNVGVRFPKNKLALEIIRETRIPLTSTSANFSGKKMLENDEDYLEAFKGKIDIFILSNKLNNKEQLSSTLVDLTGEAYKILRQGKIIFNG